MNRPLTLLLLVLSTALARSPRLQEPTPAVEPATSARTSADDRLDRVHLKNGDELVGRITQELDGYVEVELEAGATIGVSRAMVASIERAAVDAPRRAAKVRPHSEWFVLHDADGNSVGWLHGSVSVADDGTFSVNEEYEFQNGARRYKVTNIVTADADGRGRTSYYRERISVPRTAGQMLPGGDAMANADRIENERIVEATVDGESLRVMHLDGDGRSKRELPWSGEACFPLLARTVARRSGSVVGPVAMFDPAIEQLVVRSFDGTGARQMVLDGEKQRVVEVVETGANGTRGNREWVDAELRTVRRELAGPALVAVPSSADSARKAVGHSIESAIVAEADGRFGLWVPNPAWVAVEPMPAGHLQFDCPAHGAEIRLMLLEHLDVGTQLDAAADAVANWFELLDPQLAVNSRYRVRVRGREAIRMVAADAKRSRQAMLDVLPFDGSYLVLACRAPMPAWRELSADFAFVQRTVELDAAALNPRRQGPLTDDRGGRMRPKTGPIPVPTPAPRVERQGSDPDDTSVRIPR